MHFPQHLTSSNLSSFYFFFCSALSISNSLLLLYLFVVLPSSSIFSGFLPFFYFSFVHGVLNTLLSLLYCVFSLSDSHLHPYPHLSFPLLNPQPAYMCNTWGIWILFLWLTIHPKENNFQLSTALNWYPYESLCCPRLLYQWTVFTSIYLHNNFLFSNGQSIILSHHCDLPG